MKREIIQNSDYSDEIRNILNDEEMDTEQKEEKEQSGNRNYD